MSFAKAGCGASRPVCARGSFVLRKRKRQPLLPPGASMPIQAVMAGERTRSALSRIEAALVRLDAATDALAHAPAPRLDAAVIRQEVAAAIRELDQLLDASGDAKGDERHG